MTATSFAQLTFDMETLTIQMKVLEEMIQQPHVFRTRIKLRHQKKKRYRCRGTSNRKMKALAKHFHNTSVIEI